MHVCLITMQNCVPGRSFTYDAAIRKSLQWNVQYVLLVDSSNNYRSKLRFRNGDNGPRAVF